MPDGVEVRKTDATLDIFVDGEAFAVYNYASVPQGNWHPFFHPILGPGGLPITQNGEFPGTLRGHYWHQGLFIAHQKFTVGKTAGNTWEQTEGRNGRMKHVDFVAVESGAARGEFGETIDWLDASGGRTLVREIRRVTVPRRPADRRVIDFDLALSPGGAEPVTFEPTPYHLLAVRVPNSMCVLEQKQAYTRRYGSLVDFSPIDKGGQIVNSEGQSNQSGRGAHARWIDFSGPLGGGTSGVALLNHPGNFRHPTAFNNWNNMTLTAAPTFHEPHTIRAGESLRLRYRVFIHAGDAEAGRVEEEYRAYARELMAGGG